MARPQFRIERLADHDRKTFACGEVTIDRWFREQAGQMSARGLAAVHVMVDENNGAIIGYYSLSNFTVSVNELPTAMGKRLPQRIPLPAHPIGQLGVDIRHQGQGYGIALLFDALKRAERQTVESGSFGVVVHALTPSVAAWYSRIGFPAFTTQPLHLIMSMTTIRALP